MENFAPLVIDSRALSGEAGLSCPFFKDVGQLTEPWKQFRDDVEDEGDFVGVSQVGLETPQVVEEDDQSQSNLGDFCQGHDFVSCLVVEWM